MRRASLIVRSPTQSAPPVHKRAPNMRLKLAGCRPEARRRVGLALFVLLPSFPLKHTVPQPAAPPARVIDDLLGDREVWGLAMHVVAVAVVAAALLIALCQQQGTYDAADR